MKAVVTGARGTVGSVLCEKLRAQGDVVIRWNRDAVPPGDKDAARRFLEENYPDILFHLAINEEWTGHISELTADLGITLVFTSTVMVFSGNDHGPFTPASVPHPNEDYGKLKLREEGLVLKHHPEPRIVRLGWQIGNAPGSNNMIDFFHKQMAEHGAIRASSKWYPACSFLEDTAEAIIRSLDLEAGTYMADSNRQWSFAEISQALNTLHGNMWNVEVTDDYAFDQRMLDEQMILPPLSSRLSLS
ncbi:MAG: sugar nucleotide-binding protein [Verrucomicrobia bacterium]|nr:sugar nucleotide-binding protein [Verrucomicrobiota bacterium]